MSFPVKNIPDEFLEKWQSITNLLARVIKIPAALIMKTDMQNMEVFVTSKSENNPYKAGEKEQWHGLYCETVIKSQQELLIANALKDPVWDNNPGLKLGMKAYLGLPLNYPDQTPFGTLCVLDVKENSFSEDYNALLYQFKQVIELDLALIHVLDWSDPEQGRSIIQKLIKQNKECKAINRDLVDVNNRLLQEQVKAEKSETHFRSLVENAPYTIFLQIDGKFFYINKKGLELFGADTPEELIGTPVISRVHPDYQDIVRQRIANLNNQQIPQTGFEQILFKLDGTHVHVETSGIPYNYNGSNGALVFVRDITQRKEAERELIHRHRLSEFIIRHDPYGVAVFDSNLHFLFVSEKFLEDYQLRDQEVIGRHHYNVMPGIPQKWKEVHQRVLKGEILSVDEDTYLKPDGSVEIVRWECRPWYLIDDTIGGIVVYTELITQRIRLEASTRKAYELIKNLAAQVPGVIYQYRLYPDGRSAFPFSSEGMYEIYEVTPEMVKEDASVVFTRLHPDDVDYIVESIVTT
jgi:PAS domain S-box-containing protein